jgi:hypothetical protein
MIERGRLITCAAAFIVSSTRVWAVDPDYDVRLGDLVPPGEFAAGLHAVYTPSGARKPDPDVRSGHHVLQVSPTFSWGLTRDTDVELQLYASGGPRGEYRIGGAKVELAWVPMRPASDDADGYWLGAAAEVGRMPRTVSTSDLDGEVKALVGLRRGSWTIGLNPAIQAKLAGPGERGRPELSLKAVLSYKISDRLRAGIEHYASAGALRHPGPLSRQPQHTFGVVELKAKQLELNVGLGRGLNSYSERWIVKAVVGFPFEH